MCLGAIYWARFPRMYYANTRWEAAAIGFDDDFIYREIGKDPAARSIPGVRLVTTDSPTPFKQWAEKPDKVRY